MTENTDKPFSQNIFIDTGIFIHEAFQTEGFESNVFKSLIKLAENKVIKILLVDIIDREIQNFIDNDIKSSFDSVSTAIKQTSTNFSKINKSDIRLLKNIPEFNVLMDEYQNFINKYKTDEGISNLESKHKDLMIKLKDDYKQFLIKANVEIIKTDPICVEDVLNSYFSRTPPFSNKKKDEFPDALALGTILSWCNTNNNCAYIVSRDSDWKYFSIDKDQLEFKESMEQIANLFLRQYEEVQLIEFADKLIQENKEVILEEIKENLWKIPTYNYSIDYNLTPEEHTYCAPDYEICNVDITEVTDYIEIELIQIDEQSATYNLTIEALLDVEYYLEDYSMASYDKEDDRWFNVETENFTKKHRTNIEVEVEIEYTYNDAESFDIVSTSLQEQIEVEFYKSKENKEA